MLSNGVKHKKIQARELLGLFLTVRQETGRYYDNNLTRTNQHTPFIDVIRQSNLCEEIALPTKPYVSMQDLFTAKSEDETAFCSLSAVNVAKVEQSEKERAAYRDWETDRKSTRLNSSHSAKSRMPSSA